MLRIALLPALAGILAAPVAFCQLPPVAPPQPEPSRVVPVYQVTVVEHNLQAVNYEYRSQIPAEIDFRGTVLLPNAKGHATVESKRGRTEIDVKFDKLSTPQTFGRQYLTYVLWAISPEGAPHNLGEIVPNGSDSAHMHVTTDLQAFGMMVTAEPYSAVRQPSDVVVLENQVRPDTIGEIQPIEAKAELLSRGQFTYDKQAGIAQEAEDMPKVSMDEYEQLLEIYQAENALGIARAAHADELAPDTFSKAVADYNEARRLKDVKARVSLVVRAAREAAETADDARVIADRRNEENRLAAAQQQVQAAQQQAMDAQVALNQARQETQQARADADAARAQAANERFARQRAQADAAQLPPSQDLPIAPPPPPPATVPTAPMAPMVNGGPMTMPAPQVGDNRAQQQIRMNLLQQLNSVAATRDTPRGLVVTIPDSGFDGGTLRPGASDELARVAGIVSRPGMRLAVEGYSDTASGAYLSEERANAVYDALVGRGVNPNLVSTRNLADARPLTSNAVPGGHVQNRRVEIVVSGEAIGALPLWDHPYDVTQR